MGNLDDGMIVVERKEEIPIFASEADERAYWDTHALAPHLFTRRGPRPGGLAERLSKQRFQPRVVVSEEADAAYVYLRWGRPAVSKDLDACRTVDYDKDGAVLGVRSLEVSHGMELNGIPDHNWIRELLKSHTPPIRT